MRVFFFNPILVLIFFALSALAQTEMTAKIETPEEIAGRYAERSLQKDWLGMAEMMHPDELEKLKRLFAPLVEKSPKELGTIFKVSTLEEFNRLSATEVFVRMFEKISESKEIAEALSNSKAQMLGHIVENDLAHIVYRVVTKVSGATVTQISVMTVKKFETGWRVVLTQEIEGLALLISNSLNSAPPKKPIPKRRKTK